jgi:hypothetical protein
MPDIYSTANFAVDPSGAQNKVRTLKARATPLS